jgi:hypothetical protein
VLALPPLRAQRKYLEDYKGIVAELQLLYATMEFDKGTYLSFSAVLQAMNVEQAQNKIAMLLWLQSLGVDLDKIRIKLFMHMHLITSKLIWNRMCERFPNDAKKVLSVFLSRRWKNEDLLECKHDVVKCMCRTCHSSKTCAHLNCELPQPVFNAPGEI